jgi:hypothetical protein
MPTKEEIILALGAHIWWRQEFEKAVSGAWHFFNTDLAEHSYQSDLGLWLDALSPDEQIPQHFTTVQSLHADFMEQAANVVRLASSGNSDQAEADIQTGFYAAASSALTIALRDWMEAVQADGFVHGLPTAQPQVPNPNRKQPGG